jgi:hypothetical protein
METFALKEITGKRGKMFLLCCDTQMCSAFCFECGRKIGKQYDARVDTVRHLQAGWNLLNCFRGPQDVVLLECFGVLFSVRTASFPENA